MNAPKNRPFSPLIGNLGKKNQKIPKKTNFGESAFDCIVASNMIHHIPYPIKFFYETHRILKKNGKLIIFDSYCSLVLQLVVIFMKHEGFDFTVDPWSDSKPVTDENNLWAGNIAVTNMIFDNTHLFEKKNWTFV